jgi:dynein heavy chain
VEQQCIGSTTRLLTHTDFPLRAYEPKVQVPFQVLPGQCPRKIEIERYAGVGCGDGLFPGGGICSI